MWTHGATYAEISKVVGQTRSAVRVTLLRRKQRLAQAAMSGPIDPPLTQSVPPKNELDG
jgi:DNA-directed RNA polymerase specialized sigma24 family protein